MTHPAPPHSPPRRRLPGGLLCAIAAAAALLLASAGESVAQDDEAPLRLIPVQETEAGDSGGTAPGNANLRPLPGDVELRPLPGDALAPIAESLSDPIIVAPVPGEPLVLDAEGSRDEPAATASDEGGIVVGTLAEIDPDAAGVVLPGIEHFPADLWAGSRRSRIEALLPRLPALATSASVRRLALALLTSPGQPPAGAGEPGALVLSRAERLAAMGARDQALALLDRAGPPGGADAIARLRTESRLVALDYDGACEGIASRAGRTGDGYWRRVRILCQAEAGLIEAATLGLELLLESDASPDPLFDDTIYAMAGLAEPLLERLDRPTPLRVAAWRLAQFPIPSAAIATAVPDVLPTIVEAPESSPATRLHAAERAWALGTLPIEAVRALYMQTAFSPEERADALAQIVGLEPVLARALMVQAIEAQTVPALRAELLAALLSDAERHGGRLLAHALADQVRSIPPAPAHAWFGVLAGRALIAAGDRDGAAGWYALAHARGAPRLWPLMLLSADESHLTAADFDAWLASQEGDGGEADAAAESGASAKRDGLVVLLAALGGRIEPEVWDRLLVDEAAVAARAPAPAPALIHGLKEAAGAGRLGETVLMALLLLGDAGPVADGAATVGPVVSALIAVGLREEARAIALEAALAAGL